MATRNLGIYSRRYQTHIDLPGKIQFVTFRLIDAIPVALQAITPTTPSEGARWLRAHERQLRKARGCCVLRQPACAVIVRNVLLEKDQYAYDLIDWVIMPNHVHVCFQQFDVDPLGKIVGQWKGKSARLINQAIGRKGALWFREYYDRVVRDEHHLSRVIRYIHNNPVKAGLVRQAEDWPFGSGRFECARGAPAEVIEPISLRTGCGMVRRL